MNLLEAEFKGMQGRKAAIGIDSRTIALDVDTAAQGLKPSRVTIGIRPRALFPRSEAAGDTIAANVELIEPMGAETLIHARGEAGHDIRVVVPREVKLRIGERLHLKPDPRQTHLFDMEGRAVRS
jgi:ABC-type sugar transport system ATPase subunit